MQSIPGYRKAFSSNSQYALGRLLRSHSQHKNQLEAKALGVPVCTGVGLSCIHLHNQNAPRGKTKKVFDLNGLNIARVKIALKLH